MTAAQLEKELAKDVAKYFRKRGDLLMTRVEAGGTSRKRVTEPGTADWVGCLYPHGTHIEIELKTRTGAARKAQLERQYTQKRLFEHFGVPRLSLFYLT